MSPKRSNQMHSTDQQIDADLWRALQSGETEALGEIYDRHAALVYGTSLKVLKNTQEAEDLVQDIFVKLAEQTSYDPSRGSLRTFLMILTRSRAIDRLRSRQSARRSKQRWQANYSQSNAIDPAHIDSTEIAEQTEAIKQALAQLSPQQRQVLHLAYYEGLTQANIANKLKEPIGTVKSRARRGLLKLRGILKNKAASEVEPDRPLTVLPKHAGSDDTSRESTSIEEHKGND